MPPDSLESLRQSLGWELMLASFHGRILEVIALLIQGAPVNAQDDSGFTSLMRAVQSGHLEIVERLLNAGADHRIRNEDGETALSFAVGHHREEIAELLLRAGADPNVASDFSLTWLVINSNQHRMLEILLDGGASLNGSMKMGLSNLAFASQSNKPEAVKILLNRGALVSDTPEDGSHPLVFAASMGHTEIVKLLIGDASRPLSEEALRNGGTALWEAAAAGQVEVVNCLLNMGFPVDSAFCSWSRSSEMKRNETPLMAATERGHLAVVERLIAAGADVNWSRGELNPPLWLAVLNGRVEVAKVLLKAEADVHALNRIGFDLLLWVSAEGNSEMVKLLLDAGADINHLCTDNEVTALFLAASNGNEEVVKILLERGADPNVVTKTGALPLMGVAKQQKDGKKCLDVMKQLLDAGADINAVDDEKSSALVHACSVNNKAAVNFLVERAEINIVSRMGTALHIAAALGNVEVVKLLLDAGADAHIEFEGLTALQLADKYGHPNVFEVLVAHAKLG